MNDLENNMMFKWRKFLFCSSILFVKIQISFGEHRQYSLLEY